MENFEPLSLKKNPISVDDFCIILKKIAKIIKPYSVNLTGGEPFLNKEIYKVVKSIRPFCERLEITTNGSIPLKTRWNEVKGFFNRVKFSLDTLEPHVFSNITNYHQSDIISQIKENISFLRNEGENVAIYVVLLKSYVKNLFSLLDFALNENIKVQLFEFIYKEDKKLTWLNEYIKIDELISDLEKKYGKAIVENTIGGKFYKIYCHNGYIRFKSFSSTTRRNCQCDNCPCYCQEGLFFIRVSRNGWITTCSSIHEDKGVRITKDMDLETIKQRLNPLFNILNTSYLEENTFEKFLKRNNLVRQSISRVL